MKENLTHTGPHPSKQPGSIKEKTKTKMFYCSITDQYRFCWSAGTVARGNDSEEKASDKANHKPVVSDGDHVLNRMTSPRHSRWKFFFSLFISALTCHQGSLEAVLVSCQDT